MARRQSRSLLIPGEKLDFDSIDTIACEQSLWKGIPGLWLAVFVLSVKELQTGQDSEAARSFIHDEENWAMDIVADAFDLSADGLRKMVRESIPRAWPGERRTT